MVTKKYTLLDCQSAANVLGGRVLSIEYLNCREQLQWECGKGHTWTARFDSILNQKTWCPTCLKTLPPSIEELRTLAKKRGGLLLSTNYVSAKYLLSWQCKNQHVWYASWSNISHKTNPTWCPKCAGAVKPDISVLQDLAKSKRGSLLSSVYVNNSTKLKWECSNKHQWEACWKGIKNNRGCPQCSGLKTELRVRTLLSKKLCIPLPKTRFKHGNGSVYEFDGYNEEHKIAFEYHGYQHYIYPNRWHKTEEIFKAAQQRDKIKEQYCKDNGIRLIVIPYTAEKTIAIYIDTQVSNVSTN